MIKITYECDCCHKVEGEHEIYLDECLSIDNQSTFLERWDERTFYCSKCYREGEEFLTYERRN